MSDIIGHRVQGARLYHLVSAAEIANKLRLPRPPRGFRIWSDDHAAGFFVETEAGFAKVEVEIMQTSPGLSDQEWQIGLDGEPRKKRRQPVYDTLYHWSTS